MRRNITANGAEDIAACDEMDVRILGGAPDEERWDSFVRNDPEGTFFHLAGWRKVIRDFLGHDTYYLYVEKDGEVCGVLPLAHVHSRIFSNALISLPFLVYGGPVAKSEQALSALLDKAKSIAADLDVDYLELRNRSPVTDWPSKDNYVTFRRPLERDVEANLMAVPRKQRAMIRKGIKAGLEAHIDEDARRLHALLSECKRNLGTPFFSKSYLQFVKETFQEDCEITTVTKDGKGVCAVMSFVFGDEILPYYGGGPDIARNLCGNDFMYWKVMERACERGLGIFDYGRSRKNAGAYRFKKHWGFEPTTLSYEYHLVAADAVPALDPSNPRYMAMIKIWSRLPLFVARVVGPPVARLLG